MAAVAHLRDRVLTDARAGITGTGCSHATVTGVPDSVEGAYVFRNGFAEAAGLTPASAPGADSARPADECRFTWSESGFVRVP